MSSCLRRLKGSRKNAVSRKGRASIMIELLVLGLEVILVWLAEEVKPHRSSKLML